MLFALTQHSRLGSSSPGRRPGTTGLLFSSSRAKPATPYLLGGLTDAAETSNSRTAVVQRQMHEAFIAGTTGGHLHDDGTHGASNEKEFHVQTDGLERSLKDLHHKLDSFDPLNTGMSAHGKLRKKSTNKDDDDDEVENIREKFEIYKMARRIEPELPPLIPLPPVSPSRRLPDTPCIDYNLSFDAVNKYLAPVREEATNKRVVFRNQLQSLASSRRDVMLQTSTERFAKALEQKKKQGEMVVAARRDGAGTNSHQVPHGAPSKEAVAEKWVVVFGLVAFLKSAREEALFHRKAPEERMKVIKERQAAGIIKRTDAFHMRAMEMEELMKNQCTIGRLEMMGRMFCVKRKIRDKHDQSRLMAFSLAKWHPKAKLFLGFKAYINKMKYLQDWWRRKSASLREVRETIATRWESIERFGTSSPCHKEAHAPISTNYDPIDQARRTVFLENELRSRRFFLLTTIAMWEEDAKKWKAELAARKEQGLKMSKEFFEQMPLRPSHLPRGHLYNESHLKPCREHCLGPQGDLEIAAMIKACRNNPKGGGWKPVPQKNSQSKKGKGKKSGGEDGDQQAETTAAARLFGEAAVDDMHMWGVRPEDLPSIGEKPGADEGEGRFP